MSFIFYTLAISAVDSLNPFTLTQQFALQGSVKKAKHIWLFILSVLMTNYLFGVLAYFGLIQPISRYLSENIGQNARAMFIIKSTISAALLLIFLFLTVNIIKKHQKNKKTKQIENHILNDSSAHSGEEAAEEKKVKKILSVKPAALVAIGFVSTIAELTTALPYFAYLAALSQQGINFVKVLLFLVLYNVIYIAPQIILYVVYIKAQKNFDRFYNFFKKQLQRWGTILLPALALCGAIIIFFA